ncbi:MAG TPA: hypothetical protein VF310_02060, partial [Vicinamibacteria bacterium]
AALPYDDLTGPPGEPSAAVAARVLRARAIQEDRGPGARDDPSPAAKRLLEKAISRLGLTARGHDRVLRVARTIADLEGTRGRVDAPHVAEALQFRSQLVATE